jgi:hypothetical protein
MAYATDRKDGAHMREQQSGLGRNHHDAQPLPKWRLQPNQAAQRAAAYRQAAYEAADQGYTGHDAGLHPENRPFQSTDLTPGSVKRASGRTHTPISLSQDTDYELEEDESYYETRSPSSARGYQPYHVSPEHVYQQGNQRYHVRYVDVPPRRSRQAQLPPHRQRHSDIDELETERPPASVRQGRGVHSLVWLGVFLLVLLLGWMGLNVVSSWWQGVQNDWTYGKQRHFEINAVVGHRDSATNPSHFTAENNNGEIIVIELPGGNVTQAKIYQIETVPNNAGNPPVKLSFQDMNADGRPDMLVVIGDGSATLYVTLYNNGKEFVSKL